MLESIIHGLLGAENNAGEANAVYECAKDEGEEGEADECPVLLAHSKQNVKPNEDGGYTRADRGCETHPEVGFVVARCKRPVCEAKNACRQSKYDGDHSIRSTQTLDYWLFPFVHLQFRLAARAVALTFKMPHSICILAEPERAVRRHRY
jgi:hypothetical protein